MEVAVGLMVSLHLGPIVAAAVGFVLVAYETSQPPFSLLGPVMAALAFTPGQDADLCSLYSQNGTGCGLVIGEDG